MARQETTQPVTVSLVDQASSAPAAVAAAPPIVRLRFQIAPGVDPALVVEAPSDIAWRVVHVDREATGAVERKTIASGVIHASKPLELPLPLGAVATILAPAFLEIDWGKDDAGAVITGTYTLEWSPLDVPGARGYALATLGYWSGFLTDTLPGFYTPERAFSRQQAVLQFQADAGLEQDGVLSHRVGVELDAEAAKR